LARKNDSPRYPIIYLITLTAVAWTSQLQREAKGGNGEGYFECHLRTAGINYRRESENQLLSRCHFLLVLLGGTGVAGIEAEIRKVPGGIRLGHCLA
jgi:hypothetical protein